MKRSSTGIDNLPVDRVHEAVDCPVIVGIEWLGNHQDGFDLPGVLTPTAGKERVPGYDPTGVVPVVVEGERRPGLS